MTRALVISAAIAGLIATTGGTYRFYAQQQDGSLYKVDGTLSGACTGINATVDTTNSTFYVGETYYGFYRVDEGFMVFRIAGIPDDETITGAAINIYVQSEGNEDYVQLWIYKINDYTPLDKTDWNPSTIIDLSIKDAADLVTGQYTTFWLTNRLEYVAKNQSLFIWIDSDQMCVGTPPTNDQRVRFRSENYAGTDYDPYIEITTVSSAGRSIHGPLVTTQLGANHMVGINRGGGAMVRIKKQ